MKENFYESILNDRPDEKQRKKKELINKIRNLVKGIE
jgi:hypothetical protein